MMKPWHCSPLSSFRVEPQTCRETYTRHDFDTLLDFDTGVFTFTVFTLEFPIDSSSEEIFWKTNKRIGLNKNIGGKLSGKLVNV